MVSLDGQRVYLDANIIIYALEGTANYENLRTGLLEPLEASLFVAVTSELTLVETIVGARKSGLTKHKTVIRRFLSPTNNFVVEPITMVILEKTIDLRAQFGFKVPDAIHLATGILLGCDVFITNDLAWRKAGVTVVQPKELA